MGEPNGGVAPVGDVVPLGRVAPVTEYSINDAGHSYVLDMCSIPLVLAATPDKGGDTGGIYMYMYKINWINNTTNMNVHYFYCICVIIFYCARTSY